MRMVFRVWFLFASLFGFVAVSACGDDGIGVEVRVVSDLVPAREVATVEAKLYRGVANENTTSVGNAERTLEVSDPLSRGLWVVTFEDVEPGVFTIWVSLRRANGEILATRPLTVTVSDDASYTVTLTADCARAECPSPGGSAAFIACLAGECVDPSCSLETP